MQTPKLTTRQAGFVQHYLATGNATVSAISAGFSHKGAHVTACRLLRNATVQKALQARQKADAARLSLQRESVLEGLQEAVAMAREERNPMAMIAAWREIGKLLGFYTAHVKVDVNPAGGSEMARFEAMTDAELEAVVAAGAAVEG